jgi:hypothetical protein
MKLVVALVFMISPWSEAAVWLLSRVGAMGVAESHTFFDFSREIFRVTPSTLVKAVSPRVDEGIAGLMYRPCLAKITFGKRCGAPPRARTGGGLRIDAVA